VANTGKWWNHNILRQGSGHLGDSAWEIGGISKEKVGEAVSGPHKPMNGGGEDEDARRSSTILENERKLGGVDYNRNKSKKKTKKARANEGGKEGRH